MRPHFRAVVFALQRRAVDTDGNRRDAHNQRGDGDKSLGLQIPPAARCHGSWRMLHDFRVRCQFACGGANGAESHRFDGPMRKTTMVVMG